MGTFPVRLRLAKNFGEKKFFVRPASSSDKISCKRKTMSVIGQENLFAESHPSWPAFTVSINGRTFLAKNKEP
jgi:hypothetical protein